MSRKGSGRGDGPVRGRCPRRRPRARASAGGRGRRRASPPRRRRPGSDRAGPRGGTRAARGGPSSSASSGRRTRCAGGPFRGSGGMDVPHGRGQTRGRNCRAGRGRLHHGHGEGGAGFGNMQPFELAGRRRWARGPRAFVEAARTLQWGVFRDGECQGGRQESGAHAAVEQNYHKLAIS